MSSSATEIEKPKPAESPSGRLARFAADLHLSDVPAPVVNRAKLHILDALGLGLASNAYDYGRVAVAGGMALSAGGAGTCSIIGRPERMELRDAALVNGVLIHGLDFDDTHLGSIIHPTCTALPVALSLGESLGSSGEALLTAFLAGAETGIRIGGAVKGGFHHVGYHATGVVSHFASAVTAGKLLGLDAGQITAAQGITGSTASGVQVFLEEGAWTKRFHPGWGAVAGITAARLAQSGFKGPTRPYEGKFGLFDTHLHGAEVDLGELTDGLGTDWRFGDTALKPYPVCHFIHGCADAAIELHREIAGAEIASVDAFLAQPTLHIIAEPAEAKERPTTDYEAKFSAQFVVAACLLKGRFGLPDLEPAALADGAIRDLAQRVKCHEDPDTAFPTFFSGGVAVTLKDGRVLKRYVRVNSGAGERAMEPEAVAAKFMASASMTIGQDQAERIRDAVLALETVSARGLMAALRAEG
ncbi:MAG TPA: MmgE/PrpD family protein [Sphingobium sp.]|uniref:MmgE/PrpD family protein n=1 Tax=Sphingobium sp. TaxID=1912891 RepID=UPI002ED643EC